jgi:nucleoside-diphosphate-sugar epimerase
VPGHKLRAVLDTSVLVAGVLRPDGPSGQVLRVFRQGLFTHVTSSAILDEMVDVLAREKIQRVTQLMASPHGCDPVNLGNPRETSMLELATLVRDMVGSRAGIMHAPLPKDDPVRRNPDIALEQKLLGGWTPQVPLERGLEGTIAYFRGLNGRPQG